MEECLVWGEWVRSQMQGSGIEKVWFCNHQFLVITQFKDTLILYGTLDSLLHLLLAT